MDTSNQNQKKFPVMAIGVIFVVIAILVYGGMRSSVKTDSSVSNEDGVTTTKSPTASTGTTNKTTTTKSTTPTFRPTTVLKGVTYKVAVINSSYHLGEKVEIVLSVTNDNSLDTHAFNFSTNCQTTHWIGSFDSSKGGICEARATSFTIPPKSVKEIYVVHDTAISPLSLGTHTVTVDLIGYGRATTKVTIIK